MLVYGHRTVGLNVPAFLQQFRARLDRLPSAADHDTIIALLVDWGEVESAVADALLPHRDDDLEELTRWRAVSDAIADAVCASSACAVEDGAKAIDRTRAAIAALDGAAVPPDVRSKTAEGFAYYALYPEQYIAAAQRFAREHAPAAVMCVGLRSIGSILAHVVAASVRRCGIPAATRSVRPRGHPFDRRLEVSARLRASLAGGDASHFAVVDEGPGLSGSSMAAAADFLIDSGVPTTRVVLFPSWQAPAETLRSPRARAAWTRHPLLTARFEDVCLEGGRLFGGKPTAGDLSAGEWRRVCLPPPAGWPAVHPQHERRKYLGDSGKTILRFAGLGRRGASIRERALALADAGFGAEPIALAHGFLEQTWVDGKPLSYPAAPTAAVMDHFARYLGLLGRAFATNEPESLDELLEMAVTNASEGLGPWAGAPIERLAVAARDAGAPRVAVDGRMLPHEWIASDTRLFKVDALDHHDDDFWPGCRDIAWDVAGTIVEFELTGQARAYFVDAYQRKSGDRNIWRRLPFHEVAYLAYRQAYAALAADTLGDSADGKAFMTLRHRYRRSLGGRLGHSDPA
jgi:hypothetical protein